MWFLANYQLLITNYCPKLGVSSDNRHFCNGKTSAVAWRRTLGSTRVKLKPTQVGRRKRRMIFDN
jgi:hypothetical protein